MGGAAGGNGVEAVVLEKGRLAVRCGDGDLLELLEVQPANKKPMPASALLNGLGDRTLVVKPPSPDLHDPVWSDDDDEELKLMQQLELKA